MSKNPGKEFEAQFESSANSVENMFFYRIKDVLHTSLKPGARVSKNKFDSFIYKHPNLVCVELKSVQSKSIGFQKDKLDKRNKHIKWHQIDSLQKAVDTYGIIAGFVFNFRMEDSEETYFIHIDQFLEYKNVAENKLEHTYKSKVNEKSITLDICREIGMSIRGVKARTRYSYHLKDFINRLQEKYNT